MHCVGQEGRLGRVKKERAVGHFLRGGGFEVTPNPDGVSGLCRGMDDETGEDNTRGMDFELERCDDSEVPTASSDAPKEVRVVRLAGGQELTVGSNDIDRQ